MVHFSGREGLQQNFMFNLEKFLDYINHWMLQYSNKYLRTYSDVIDVCHRCSIEILKHVQLCFAWIVSYGRYQNQMGVLFS